MLPSPTDFFALLGINLVLCAMAGRLLCRGPLVSRWACWVLAVLFLLLWLPVGSAPLPVVAYIRGVSSDPSVTLVLLACLGLARRLLELPQLAERESMPVFLVVAVAALLLYPTALGWGDFDAYRLGWGSAVMWLVLLALCAVGWLLKLRLLPLLIAAAMLAWVAGLMESGNLWDYLMDPWLVATAFVQCLGAGIRRLFTRVRPSPDNPVGVKG